MAQLPWTVTDDWLDRAAGSIRARESSNNYRARGPVITNPRSPYHGQQAAGAYQVMPGNLPGWLSEAGMPAMTVDQFLANPQAQDQLFRHRFGMYARQGGPEHAASMWFTGRPYATGRLQNDTQPGTHRGITGETYVNDFFAGMGVPFGVPRIPGANRQAEVSTYQPMRIDQQQPSAAAPMPAASPFGAPTIPPGPGAAEPGGNYFDRLTSNPAFLAGLSILGTAPGGNWGQAGAQAFAAGQRGRREQAEYERTQRQRARADEIWARAFPNGQPNASHPLMQGVPPDVAAAVYAMGPEAGIAALGQLAMQRVGRQPWQTIKLGDGTEVSVQYDSRRGVYVLPDGSTLPEAMGGALPVPPGLPGPAAAAPAALPAPAPAAVPGAPGPAWQTSVLPAGPQTAPAAFGFGSIGPGRRVAGIHGGLERLAQVPAEYGSENLERAIGPWSGADVSVGGQGIAAQAANFLPTLVARIPAEIDAAVRGGASPTEVRNRIAGDMQALAASIKPLIRKPGEGTWTNADQQKLENIIGNLASARTVPEYMRQLEGVRQRLITNFQLQIPELRPQTRSANPPPMPGRERSWGQMLGQSSPELEEARAESERLERILRARRN